MVQHGIDHSIFDEKLSGFLCAQVQKWRLPVARLLLKIHKLSLQSRLVAAGTCWVTNNIASLVGFHLNKAIDQEPFVAKDTASIIENIENLNRGNLPHDLQIASVEVEALCPSISQPLALRACRRILTKFLMQSQTPSWGLWVGTLVAFVEIIFSVMLVTYSSRANVDRRVYLQIIGISTGLWCAFNNVRGGLSWGTPQDE